MDKVRLDDIQLSPLKRIPTSGGDVMHALKRSDLLYNDFGEAYFSWVDFGSIKAWKRHGKMTLNLIVPLGEVLFAFYDPDSGTFRKETLGESFYSRLTVPPNIWYGFQGLSEPQSLLLNIGNIEHDPQEVDRKEVDTVPFQWDKIII